MSGKQDIVSNYLSARKWLASIEQISKQTTEFRIFEMKNGDKQAYSKRGRVTYLEVENGGHMIVGDQPETTS